MASTTPSKTHVGVTIIKVVLQLAALGFWWLVALVVDGVYCCAPHQLPLWWRAIPCVFLALNFGVLCFVRRVHPVFFVLTPFVQFAIGMACVLPLGGGV